MCGIINQCLLNNKFPHAHSQCSMNASESKGANLIYLYLFPFMMGSSHFWICHLISRWDGHGYQARLFTVNSSDWSTNKAKGLFFKITPAWYKLLRCQLITDYLCVKMNENESRMEEHQQSLHRPRWKVWCQTPSRLIIIKKKKRISNGIQQWIGFPLLSKEINFNCLFT